MMIQLNLPFFLRLFFALTVACASACSSFSLLTPPLISPQINGASVHENYQYTLFKQFQDKKPYTGLIKIGVHTELLNPHNPVKHVDFGSKLNSQTFQTQSMDPTPVLFQEAFTKGKGDYEVIRGFRVPDTNQRYTLHVEQIRKASDGYISVNINGIDWLKSGDFKGKEFEIKTLLLNANNSLRIRLHGKEGSTFVVRIIQGGESGILLRRQGKLGSSIEDQDSHVKQNDTNIFDPSDPQSLGGLKPYDGEMDDYGVCSFGDFCMSKGKGRILKGV